MKNYWKITGDPFIDAGGFVIKNLTTRFPEKNILELIGLVTHIYVKNWNAGLHSFFLNSTITQAAFQGERKINETERYFQKLLNGEFEHKLGQCRITGDLTKLYSAGRENFILSGSGTFINFHHAFEKGIYVSKEAIIRMFFVPLGVIYLSDKISLLHSNNCDVIEYFVNKNCSNNLGELASNFSNGVLKSKFKNAANCLFEFAEDCIMNLKVITDSKEGVNLNLYHFTNFGASPFVNLYTFPATLFTFHKLCLNQDLKTDWKKFVSSHYRNSKYAGARYSDKDDEYQLSKKDGVVKVNVNDYKTWTNPVLAKLLIGESILKIILNWSKKNKFDFRIVRLYQQKLKSMDKNTLKKIDDLADFIVKDQVNLKKGITRLNGLKKSYEMRAFLLSLITQNYKEGNNQPLITVQEYVEYLFPDGTYWSEVRDLLLIALYQKMHERNIELEVEFNEPELPETENELIYN